MTPDPQGRLETEAKRLHQRIAIIGGGLSGLATAHYVKQLAPSADYLIFESSSRVGGVIHSERIECDEGSFLLDHGADMFATDPPAALALCQELGLEDELLLPNLKDAGALILHRGQLVPIPSGFVLARATKLWPMLTTPILSPMGKLRFLCERFIPRSPATRPGGDSDGDSDGDAHGGADNDESVADFIRHRMGAEVLDRLAGPLISGIYTADMDSLSLQATLGPIADMVREHGSLARATAARRRAERDGVERDSAGARYQRFRGFPEGTKQLIDRLAESVGRSNIQLNSPVDRIEHLDGKTNCWAVHAGDKTESFDQIVLALPTHVTARLLDSLGGESVSGDALRLAAKRLAAIRYASAAIVVMAVKKSQVLRLPRQFGFVIPPREKRKILAVSFASHKYPSRCPEDHSIVRTFIGGATQPELLQLDDAALLEIAKDELTDLIGLRAEPTLSKVVRWNQAMPQYQVGHKSRVREIEAAVASLPGLHLSTNAFHGVGIAPVVANSKRTAKRIADAMG